MKRMFCKSVSLQNILFYELELLYMNQRGLESKITNDICIVQYEVNLDT